MIRIILILLVLLTISTQAEAQNYTNCYTSTLTSSAEVCPDQGTAAIQARRVAQYNLDNYYPNHGFTVGHPKIRGNIVVVALEYNGAKAIEAWRSWPEDKSCSDIPPSLSRSTRGSVIGGGIPETGAIGCRGGCEMAIFPPSSGGSHGADTYPLGGVCDPSTAGQECINMGWTWAADLQICYEPEDDKCPEGQHKDDTGACVVDEDKEPEDPEKPDPEDPEKPEKPDPEEPEKPGEGNGNGEGGGDGEGNGNGNGEGNGNGSGNAGGSFSWGGSCSSPPACSGDAVLCGQVRIQWNIDCNTRKDDQKISGMSCDAIPVCAGKDCNAMEYSQLLAQWRSACALEKMAQQGEDGDGDLDAIKETLTGSSQTDLGEEGDPASVWREDVEVSGKLDDSGFGYARSCPAIPPIKVMGSSFTLDTSSVCTFLEIMGKVVLILAGLSCVRILGSGG